MVLSNQFMEGSTFENTLLLEIAAATKNGSFKKNFFFFFESKQNKQKLPTK